MESCLKGAKNLIDKQVTENRVSLFGISFSRYHKSYFWTNENITAYLNHANFEGKTNALSVLASGDHAFNLITCGITNIDTFDTNMLTEYIALGLKRALILKYNYEDFLKNVELLCSDTMTTEFFGDIINGLLPFMDKRMQLFWKELVAYNYRLQKEYGTNLNLLQMLCVNIGIIGYKESNNYLLNKDAYELLRSRLTSANITFKRANAMNLVEEFDIKYDFILLSNILDYFDAFWGAGWDYSYLEKYEQQLELLSKKEAIIFLHYVLYYAGENPILFGDSSITPNKLRDEALIKLKDDYCGMPTGIILKRVK